MSDPSRASSSLSKPTAFSSAAPRNELLQTSSASAPDVWAGPLRFGRIFVQVYVDAAARRLPRRLAGRESAPNNGQAFNVFHEGLCFDGFFLVGRLPLPRGACGRRRTLSEPFLHGGVLLTTYEPQTGQRCTTTGSHEMKSQVGIVGAAVERPAFL